MTAIDMRYSSTVEGLVQRMRKGGVDFSAYYEPVIREIHLSASIYVGTIILLYPRTGPDLTESGAAILDRLRPFLAFLLSDGIARQRATSPERHDFQKSLIEFASAHSMTPREREVLVMHVFGMSYDQISRSLSLAPATIRNHISSIHRKSGVGSRGDLLAKLLGPGGFGIPIDESE